MIALRSRFATVRGRTYELFYVFGPSPRELQALSKLPAAASFSSADGKPVNVGDKHADILWVSDIRTELGIFPHNVSSCSPVVVGDKIFMATSNGVDWSHLNIPAPFAPALVAVDKNRRLPRSEKHRRHL